MTKAYYRSVYTFSGGTKSHTIHGIVTQDNDGKIHVSLPGTNNYTSSYAERLAAKALAHKIVAAGFKHEAVYSLERTNTKGLVEILLVETREFKKQYIQRVREHSVRTYAWAKTHAGYGDTDYRVRYGTFMKSVRDYSVATRWENGRRIEAQKLVETLNPSGERARTKAEEVLFLGFIKFQAQEVNAAARHYNDSIEKLALRLTQMGVTDQTEMTIKTAKIGLNIETQITTPDRTIRAWTIVAAEDSSYMRPHYRYLVK